MPTDFISEERRLAFFVLDHCPSLVIATFGANCVGRNSTAALGAIADLTPLYAMVRASFAGSAVGMFTFRDSHGCIVRFVS
jgi:hypothetical protein